MDALTGEVVCDVGKVATEEGFAEGGGFEEGEAKAFGDRGGDDVGGVGSPGLVGGGVAFGGGDAVDDVKKNGELVFFGKMCPAVVDRLPGGVLGCEGDGKGGVGGSEGGKEEEFAEVFAADSADGVEDEILV